MKHIGKISTLIILSIVIMLFSSCSIIDNVDVNEIVKSGKEITIESIRGSQLTSLLNEEGKLIEVMSEEIIRCFTQRDKEALKELFSEKVRSQPGFDEAIDEAFEFFLCDNYTNSEYDTIAGGGSSTRDGERISWYVCPQIDYIKVLVDIDEDPKTKDFERRYYGIYYNWQIINAKDTSLEGIDYMLIEYLNVDSFKIGEQPYSTK